MKDNIVEKVKQKYDDRSRVGIEKYNTTLENDHHTDLNGWLKHLQEELMDATLYIEKLMSKHTVHLGTIKPYKYPEFWEEVIEKDYEILSFKNIKSKDITDTKVTLWCSDTQDWYKDSDSIEYTIRTYGIESVKRLSDGEIFTIGDRVRIKKLKHDGSFIIDKFYFDCNNDKLLCNGKDTGNGHVSITKIEHSKVPLFTTEDGVDIFEGDAYYNVCDNFLIYQNTLAKSPCEYIKGRNFSSREAAEEYVIMNKSCLSVNDLKNIIKYQTFSSFLITKAKELVKSRL